MGRFFGRRSKERKNVKVSSRVERVSTIHSDLWNLALFVCFSETHIFEGKSICLETFRKPTEGATTIGNVSLFLSLLSIMSFSDLVSRFPDLLADLHQGRQGDQHDSSQYQLRPHFQQLPFQCCLKVQSLGGGAEDKRNRGH